MDFIVNPNIFLVLIDDALMKRLYVNFYVLIQITNKSPFVSISFGCTFED